MLHALTTPAYLSFAENKLSDQEALEEIRQLSVQLKRIQEMAPPKGVAVMTISSLLDGLKTPGGMIVVAAAATHAPAASTAASTRQSALPLLALNAEMQKYNQQLQQNNNAAANGGGGGGRATSRGSIPTMVLETPPSTATPTPTGAQYEERAMNTELSGDDFREQLLRRTADGHIICSRCLDASLQHFCCCPPPATVMARTACEQLGSPQQEGSLSFANIKLDCMCSQSEDLDLEPRQPRRPAVRSAATNTPPPSCKRQQQARNLLETELSISYQICDNCRSKFKLSDRSTTPPTVAPVPLPVVGRRRSGSCSAQAPLLQGPTSGHVARSSDDIALYTSNVAASVGKAEGEQTRVADEQAAQASSASEARAVETATTAVAAPSLGNISSTSNSSSTNQAGRAKRPDKLVLDLNDRSKYTKEVSV